MTRDVLADTGPLYAANDEADAYHQRSIRELKELARDRRGVMIAYPILLEGHSLLLFKLGRHAATEWLNEVEKIQFVSPTATDYGHAIVTVRALADQRITLFDATLAALAMRLGLEVWTYDHDFDVMRAPIWRG